MQSDTSSLWMKNNYRCSRCFDYGFFVAYSKERPIDGAYSFNCNCEPVGHRYTEYNPRRWPRWSDSLEDRYVPGFKDVPLTLFYLHNHFKERTTDSEEFKHRLKLWGSTFIQAEYVRWKDAQENKESIPDLVFKFEEEPKAKKEEPRGFVGTPFSKRFSSQPKPKPLIVPDPEPLF